MFRFKKLEAANGPKVETSTLKLPNWPKPMSIKIWTLFNFLNW